MRTAFLLTREVSALHTADFVYAQGIVSLQTAFFSFFFCAPAKMNRNVCKKAVRRATAVYVSTRKKSRAVCCAAHVFFLPTVRKKPCGAICAYPLVVPPAATHAQLLLLFCYILNLSRTAAAAECCCVVPGTSYTNNIYADRYYYL